MRYPHEKLNKCDLPTTHPSFSLAVLLHSFAPLYDFSCFATVPFSPSSPVPAKRLLHTCCVPPGAPFRARSPRRLQVYDRRRQETASPLIKAPQPAKKHRGPCYGASYDGKAFFKKFPQIRSALAFFRNMVYNTIRVHASTSLALVTVYYVPVPGERTFCSPRPPGTSFLLGCHCLFSTRSPRGFVCPFPGEENI